jgi:hypothetical protein
MAIALPFCNGMFFLYERMGFQSIGLLVRSSLLIIGLDMKYQQANIGLVDTRMLDSQVIGLRWVPSGLVFDEFLMHLFLKIGFVADDPTRF